MKIHIFFIACLINIKIVYGASWDISQEEKKPLRPVVEKLLRNWLDSQNKRDFSAYRQLYDKQFSGVRRTGTKELKFDLNGWLKDRSQMFRQKMWVHISDATLNPNDEFGEGDFVFEFESLDPLVIKFDQTWASDNFRDQGIKTMQLVKRGNEWKIKNESLGESKTLPFLSEKTFIPAVHGSIIIDKNALPVWGKGKKADAGILELSDGLGHGHSRSSHKLKSQDMDFENLPTPVRGWLGRKITVFATSGKACETTIEALSLRQISGGGEGYAWTKFDVQARVNPACAGTILWFSTVKPDQVEVLPFKEITDDKLKKELLTRLRNSAQYKKVVWGDPNFDGSMNHILKPKKSPCSHKFWDECDKTADQKTLYLAAGNYVYARAEVTWCDMSPCERKMANIYLESNTLNPTPFVISGVPVHLVRNKPNNTMAIFTAPEYTESEAVWLKRENEINFSKL